MICPFCKQEIDKNTIYTVILKKSGEKIDRINLYGTLCPYCDEFIEPEYELPVVKENKEKKLKLLEKARESIKRKFGWRIKNVS
jgi:hypothetical protein